MSLVHAEEVMEFPYGDLAVALYFAPNLPFPQRRRLSLQELANHGRQGTERLGGIDAVREQHARWVELNTRFLTRQIDDDDYGAELRKMWPNQRRLDRCVYYDLMRFDTSRA